MLSGKYYAIPDLASNELRSKYKDIANRTYYLDFELRLLDIQTFDIVTVYLYVKNTFDRYLSSFNFTKDDTEETLSVDDIVVSELSYLGNDVYINKSDYIPVKYLDIINIDKSITLAKDYFVDSGNWSFETDILMLKYQSNYNTTLHRIEKASFMLQFKFSDSDNTILCGDYKDNNFVLCGRSYCYENLMAYNPYFSLKLLYDEDIKSKFFNLNLGGFPTIKIWLKDNTFSPLINTNFIDRFLLYTKADYNNYLRKKFMRC